ncbi:hypothetical protein MMC10_010136 [Thelotrema lepadinum]|nr:hypothetical protein [Thelotrema lepadinum]
MIILRHASQKYTVFITTTIFLILIFSRSHFLPLQFHLPNSKTEKQPAISKVIVAAARATEDVSWMSKIGDGWEPYAYNVDNTDPTAPLQIPKNKGHEAMVYLSFIIDRYDSLPNYTIFVQGHEKAWHQEDDLMPLIRNLRLPALDAAGYVPLRCDWYPSCPAEIKPITHDAVVWGPGVHRQDAEDGIVEVWPRFFPGVELPETIAGHCCAQFAVTAGRIRSGERETYVKMREWLLETALLDDVSGRVLEKLWAFIFTEEAVQYLSVAAVLCLRILWEL